MPNKNVSKFFKTAFIDPGGTLDDYFLTMTSTDIENKIIYVTGAMHWLLNDNTGITFAKIRNDIAKLHLINRFNLFGCEKNNYGLSEIQSLRREYHMRVIQINTSGKVTSEQALRKGESMDKHQMVRWANSWRQNAFEDPDNDKLLGQVYFPKRKTPEIRKIISELDTFIVEKPNTGGNSNPKYHAEEGSHDDGVMSLLGNLFIVKERVMRIMGFDERHVGSKIITEEIPDIFEDGKTVGRSMGAKSNVESDNFYSSLGSEKAW